MLSFECDYNTGAHPDILRRLAETNLDCQPGYGADVYTLSAKRKIAAACGADIGPDDVELLAGGTQTNAVVIASMLPDWSGVVAPDTGHINVHESGAIEYTGHKVIPLKQERGKLDAEAFETYLKRFYADTSREHMVYPGMVYLTLPTEYGTLYSKAELTRISGIAREYGLIVYIDGARLAYALASEANDLTLTDLCRLCDVFYIGGTKVGALCGEAVVFTQHNKPLHFMNAVKKRGALLAKGRLLGVQFDALFTDDLYFRIGQSVIAKSEALKAVLDGAGLEYFLKTPTNQQFVLLENGFMARLSELVRFDYWGQYDEFRTIVRFAAGWSTTDADLQGLALALRSCAVPGG